ncbi:MAG: TonB-dependent receptor [Kaiparowitsia implicata GSE-PSE-MK54-09C]|jgi:iron complex outermembrane receptor protein|nr:TonB-dependent receptor [Kaiparowitsia implicata GSE-PSE-MK54-09C]
MNQRQRSTWVAGALLVLMAGPAWAEATPELEGQGANVVTEVPRGGATVQESERAAEPSLLSQVEQPATTIDEWWAEIAQAMAQITAVRLNPTADGVEVVLETSAELAASSSVVGNALIVDIANATLALPEGGEFQAANPTEGIALVSVVPLGDGVRVAITGAEAPPTAAINAAAQRLVLSVARGTATTASDEEAIQVVVTATRSEAETTTIPRSVTVITQQAIQQQTSLSRDLNDILGNLVPGLAPSSERAFTAASLRGRDAAILIDGVPQNVNNRDFDRELRTLDPSIIERIEVVRGPSAIYGGGATGGIINIITRQPDEADVSATSEVSVNSALGSLQAESFGYFARQTVSARNGNADILASLSRADAGGLFDGQGDRIPTVQGTDENENVALLTRLGYRPDDNQRLQFSLNYYRESRNSDVIADPSVDDADPGERKASALQIGQLRFPEGGGPQADRNLVLNLSYRHDNVLNGSLDSQLYYRDNSTRSDPRDRRPRPFGIFQGNLESENWGGRLGLNTPLGDSLSLLWGADYNHETTANTFNLFDPNAFDASNGRVNRLIEQRPLVPPYTLSSLGLFSQLQWQTTDWLQLSGGLRHERIGFSVGDYTTFFGDPIAGGDRSFSDTAFNAGAVADVTPEISLFANFAQGFSVPDFGVVLGFADPDFTVNSDVQVNQPQKVSEYEVGIRGNWNTVQASISGFYNTSELGSTFVFDDDTGLYDLVRAPERVYGLEATLDVQPSPTWRLGTTLSLIGGEADLDDTGEFTAISSTRIQPLKLTAYVENETLPGWRNRLQLLYVGSRSAAFDAEVDPSPINSYAVVDLISSVDVGPGTLAIGINNLFDTLYFPAYAQRTAGFSNTFNSAGSGRRVSVGYRVTF